MRRSLFKILSYLALLACNMGLSTSVGAQTVYKAGFGEASIEPGSYPFSLALAGYGAPREGRFSLQWVNSSNVDHSTSLTGAGNQLFCISNHQIMKAKAGGQLVWKNVMSANKIRLLAAGTSILYAVDVNGHLLTADSRQSIKWKRVGIVDDAIALTVTGNFLYKLDDSGNVSHTVVRTGRKMVFKKIAQLPGLTSITAYRDQLYGITTAGEIYKTATNSPNGQWLKIARYEGFNYKVKPTSIAIAGNRLYGADSSAVYSASHSTKGLLSVNALALAGGNKTVVLMGADLCGFDASFVNQVKQEAGRLYKLAPEAILMNASHTHFAPVSQQWLTWGEFCQRPDSFYLYEVIKPAMLKVIGSAMKDLAPSNLYFGRGNTAIGRNRSLLTGPPIYDNTVDVLTVENISNKKKTVLFLTGCHPVFNNEGAEGTTITPNFPGITRHLLRKDSNIKGALFLQGCAGDINPVNSNHVETGLDLYNDVQAVLGGSEEKLSGPVSYFMDTIHFPVQHWTTTQIGDFRQNNTGKTDVTAEKNVRWADLMMDWTQKGTMPDDMPVFVQTINVGNWKLVGLSREVVTEYSIGIKALWPGKLVSVAGYCNDVSSYLPTEKHINAHAYEGYDSFFWYAQPALFPTNVYQIIIDKIKNSSH